jgi:hypothetical protein
MKKRIVTCPECEVKLSVFDFGKPINQKCPKCSKTFVIESEEKDETKKADDKADAAKPAGDDEKKAEASTDDATKAGATVKAAEDKGKEDKKEDKESKDKPADKSEKKDASEKKSDEAKTSDKDKALDKDKASDKASDKKEPVAKDKEITPKKSAAPAGGIDKPAASSTDLDDVELHAAPGPSPLFSMIMLGGLILLIVMQVMMKTRADRQYKTLIEHLQYIEKNLIK